MAKFNNRAVLVGTSLMVISMAAVAVDISIVSSAMSPEGSYSIARGGRLYDKWFSENKMGKPDSANQNYPSSGQYKGNKGNDWRCKECHGWDYIGAKGSYAQGKHYTGFTGIEGAVNGTAGEVISLLQNRSHRYSAEMLNAEDMEDLALFVTQGQLDMDSYIDRDSKAAKGNAMAGKNYYQTICAVCHGLDGKGEDTPPLGKLSWKNPWEVLHKTLNGQPNDEMPALRAFGIQPSVDILAYIQDELPR